MVREEKERSKEIMTAIWGYELLIYDERYLSSEARTIYWGRKQRWNKEIVDIKNCYNWILNKCGRSVEVLLPVLLTTFLARYVLPHSYKSHMHCVLIFFDFQ